MKILNSRCFVLRYMKRSFMLLAVAALYLIGGIAPVLATRSYKLAQDSVVALVEDPDKVYELPDETAQYHGGNQALYDFLNKNIKYPQEAQKKGEQGRVFVRFIVEKDGKVTEEPKVIRSVSPILDAEAVRVAKLLKFETPSKKDGKPVRAYFVLPIIFKLDSPKEQPAKVFPLGSL